MIWTTSMIIETDAAMDILRECGTEAFAVYCFLEVRKGPVGIEDLAKACSFSIETTERAVQKLGEYQLGIRVQRLSTDTPDSKVVELR
ncbi:hypothetical protein [Alicyclobacillus mengziensis]|uniref:Uncharacterized protein n=1 Tax=Alicyclobacillus mengziensis TaxID=2931921 RepID=A0A9X7W481_9BACL|nr:hypothetical protein [Alicyclobacillus mengziensis]QSO50100.1 hypothetical protein JZ786_24605 [Alicyclobacillus mengziensis]